jgi:hypothetical protein
MLGGHRSVRRRRRRGRSSGKSRPAGLAVPLAIPMALGLALGIILAVSGGNTRTINQSSLGASAGPSPTVSTTPQQAKNTTSTVTPGQKERHGRKHHMPTNPSGT